jgi:hypothetical protein
MNLQKVAARRAMLLQRIAQQRIELGELAQSLQGPASFFDKGYALAQKVRQHPILMWGSALLGLIVFRKRLSIAKMSVTALTLVKWGLSLKKLLPASFRRQQ